MERTYALVEVTWTVPDGEHEDWSLFKGRLTRPVRFRDGDGGLWDMCFALADVERWNSPFLVPVWPLCEQPQAWMVKDAGFEVIGSRWTTVVAVGRVVSLESVEEERFYHLFRVYAS